MKSAIVVLLVAVLLCLHAWPAAAQADHPRPSLFPVAWEFDFEYDTPRRIVVEVPGQPTPQAYWYMTYTVTNNTDRERMFFPRFEMLTADGRVIRSDRNIPVRVFETIRQREGNRFLEHAHQIAGELRLGEDQARDGVAIWPEPTPRMGTFSIFIEGLSGETARVDTGEGEQVILRKTLHLTYHVPGGQQHVGQATRLSEEWIMR